MLQGMTAQYLLKSSYPVKAGDTILIMAAAGGVGQILSQWAKYLGAKVIGCVGSEAKAELAKDAGCDHTILYNIEDVAQRVRDITGGAGVPVSMTPSAKPQCKHHLIVLCQPAFTFPLATPLDQSPISIRQC